MNNKESDYEALYSAMEKIIEKKVYEIIDKLGIESSDYGVVNSLDNYSVDGSGKTTSVSHASITLLSGEIVDNLSNTSGEILKVGDKVKIFGSRKNISNRYIGMRYE